MPKLITIGQVTTMDIPDPKFILGPLQPGDVGLISGADGAGKTWVAMMAGLTVATGVSVGGIFGPPDSDMVGKAIYFAGEDRLNDHAGRLQFIIQDIKQDGVNIDDPDDDRMKIVVMEGARKPLVAPGNLDEPRYIVTREGRKFEEEIAGHRLVVLDPLRMFHDLEEVDGVGMDYLIRYLVSVAMKHQLSILVVHHVSQSAMLGARDDHHVGRGSTELPAGSRSVWVLRLLTLKESEAKGVMRRDWRCLSNPKASHAAESETKYLNRGDNGVLRASDLPNLNDNLKGGYRKKSVKSVGRDYGYDF
ncbi:MAG TPA: AAA family ATPase [Halothiobacillus sp.]|nr:AAA family ATPase [Halothiobacillus sp.]